MAHDCNHNFKCTIASSMEYIFQLFEMWGFSHEPFGGKVVVKLEMKERERDRDRRTDWNGRNVNFVVIHGFLSDYLLRRIPCISAFVYAIHINALSKKREYSSGLNAIHVCTLQKMLKKLAKEDGNEKLWIKQILVENSMGRVWVCVCVMEEIEKTLQWHQMKEFDL